MCGVQFALYPPRIKRCTQWPSMARMGAGLCVRQDTVGWEDLTWQTRGGTSRLPGLIRNGSHKMRKGQKGQTTNFRAAVDGGGIFRGTRPDCEGIFPREAADWLRPCVAPNPPPDLQRRNLSDSIFLSAFSQRSNASLPTSPCDASVMQSLRANGTNTGVAEHHLPQILCNARIQSARLDGRHGVLSHAAKIA